MELASKYFLWLINTGNTGRYREETCRSSLLTSQCTFQNMSVSRQVSLPVLCPLPKHGMTPNFFSGKQKIVPNYLQKEANIMLLYV